MHWSHLRKHPHQQHCSPQALGPLWVWWGTQEHVCPLTVCTHEVAFSYCSVLRDQLQALLRTAAYSGLGTHPPGVDCQTRQDSLKGLASVKETTESERSRIRKNVPHPQCSSHSEVSHHPNSTRGRSAATIISVLSLSCISNEEKKH